MPTIRNKILSAATDEKKQEEMLAKFKSGEIQREVLEAVANHDADDYPTWNRIRDIVKPRDLNGDGVISRWERWLPFLLSALTGLGSLAIALCAIFFSG